MQFKNLSRLLVLLLCVALAFCFTACGDDASGETDAPSSDLSSATDSAYPDKDNTSSGIELEEDVFDEEDVSSSPSGSNTQSGSNTNSSTDKNNQSSNQSTNNSSSNTSSSTDNSSKEENNNSSETESIVEENDGTVKLPVDWF